MPLTRLGSTIDLRAFHRIIRTAAAAGILAGLVLTGVQQMQVVGLIAQAEVYEAADAAPAPEAHAHATGHEHAASHEHAHEHAHEAPHEHGGWQPDNGLDRTFFTALANVSMAVGFGLLLAGAVSLRGDAGWRKGVLWGAAGYVVFFVAPSFGLPPELPGTAAAALEKRQLWWLSTVLATGSGLALLAFARAWPLKLVGVAFLGIAHLVGAPQPLVHASAAPPDLARAFIGATACANAAFWLTLGGLTGYFIKKFD